jgi:hypothetical protein
MEAEAVGARQRCRWACRPTRLASGTEQIGQRARAHGANDAGAGAGALTGADYRRRVRQRRRRSDAGRKRDEEEKKKKHGSGPGCAADHARSGRRLRGAPIASFRTFSSDTSSLRQLRARLPFPAAALLDAVLLVTTRPPSSAACGAKIPFVFDDITGSTTLYPSARPAVLLRNMNCCCRAAGARAR